jgi:hypothetical protein
MPVWNYFANSFYSVYLLYYLAKPRNGHWAVFVKSEKNVGKFFFFFISSLSVHGCSNKPPGVTDEQMRRRQRLRVKNYLEGPLS